MYGSFITTGEGGRIDLTLGSKSNRAELTLSNGLNKTSIFLNEEELECLEKQVDALKDILSDRRHKKEMNDIGKDDKLSDDEE